MNCFYCGCVLSLEAGLLNSFTRDHKTPRSKGGGDEEDNLAAACVSCNARKGTKTVQEYREYLHYRKGDGRALFHVTEALDFAVSQKWPDEKRLDLLKIGQWLLQAYPEPLFPGERTAA